MSRACRSRAAATFVVAVGLVVTAVSSARGEAPGAAAPPRWLFEPGARLNADVAVGDARSIIHQAFGGGLTLSAGREGSPHRWRASLEIEPVTDIGPGASLELMRAELGLERLWRRHLVTAFDVGAVFRRLSIWDELTRTAPGVGASAAVGGRFLAAARWSMTGGVRYSASWFTPDGFLWQQLGVFVGLERLAAVAR